MFTDKDIIFDKLIKVDDSLFTLVISSSRFFSRQSLLKHVNPLKETHVVLDIEQSRNKMFLHGNDQIYFRFKTRKKTSDELFSDRIHYWVNNLEKLTDVQK